MSVPSNEYKHCGVLSVGMAVPQYGIQWRGQLSIGCLIPVFRDNAGANSLGMPTSYILYMPSIPYKNRQKRASISL